MDQDPRGGGGLASLRQAASVLEVSLEDSPSVIREAYLRKIKDHAPDRDPDAFETIRQAYDILKDPKRRRMMLITGDEEPVGSLVDVLDRLHRQSRARCGPGPWLAVLQEPRGKGPR